MRSEQSARAELPTAAAGAAGPAGERPGQQRRANDALRFPPGSGSEAGSGRTSVPGRELCDCSFWVCFSMLPDRFSLKECGSYSIQASALEPFGGSAGAGTDVWGEGGTDALAHPAQGSPSFLTYCKPSGLSSGKGQEENGCWK